MPRYLDLAQKDGQLIFEGRPDEKLISAGGVNAGDAAAILAESPFETAYGLWQLKTKRRKKPPPNQAMLGGRITEPLIFAWYKDYAHMEGRSQVWAVYDAEEGCEWIRGLGDFWNAELRHGAEFKAPARDDSADHRNAKEGGVPFHYLLQCWHLMEVYDALTWEYVSWRSPDDYAVVPVERNTDFWLTVMVPAYLEFWRRVQENEWPMPTGNTREESEAWRDAATLWLESDRMASLGKSGKERATAAITRLASAKLTTGAGVKAMWSARRPKYEAKISADTPAALAQIMAALKPLEGRQGVGKISQVETPENLILQIKPEKE